MKELADRVSDLESQVKDYEEKAAEILNRLAAADALPDRLEHIEDAASPLKDESDDSNGKLVESIEKERSTLETLGAALGDLEKKMGINV